MEGSELVDRTSELFKLRINLAHLDGLHPFPTGGQGGRCCGSRQLALEGFELGIHFGCPFQGSELTFQISPRQFSGGLAAGLEGLHLLLHLLEGRHGRIRAEIAHGALKLLLGLGGLGPRLEHVLFGFGFGDLALELHQALFELIHLAGSVELGPITGMSEAIVDLVATGRTLEENGLIAIEDLFHSTARLVGHPLSLRLDSGEIQSIVDQIASAGA